MSEHMHNDSQGTLQYKDSARDFYGKECPLQPQGDELLVLSRSPWSSGCDKQDYGPQSGSSQEIDVLKLYKENRPSVVYFQMKGQSESDNNGSAGKEAAWGGSGFVVASEGTKALILTDNHVVMGTGMAAHMSVLDTNVVLADGEILKGKVVSNDLSRDLALVEINTGAKTTELKPIEIADKQIVADGSQALLSFGQPYTSGSIYTTSGNADKIAKRSEFSGLIKPLDGEDPNREILSMLMPIREGFSGAAVIDKEGKAVGVADIQTSPFTAIATPITKALIEEMKARRHE